MSAGLQKGARRLGASTGLIAMCLTVAVGGCTMTETQQRTASGAGIGAGVGAAAGAATGQGAVKGGLLGGAAGGAAGVLTDEDDVDLGDPLWRR
jgi:osmotically inducible lipoprotein OsmB